jgi:hypothetical protein
MVANTTTILLKGRIFKPGPAVVNDGARGGAVRRQAKNGLFFFLVLCLFVHLSSVNRVERIAYGSNEMG